VQQEGTVEGTPERVGGNHVVPLVENAVAEFEITVTECSNGGGRNQYVRLRGAVLD